MKRIFVHYTKLFSSEKNICRIFIFSNHHINVLMPFLLFSGTKNPRNYIEDCGKYLKKMFPPPLKQFLTDNCKCPTQEIVEGEYNKQPVLKCRRIYTSQPCLVESYLLPSKKVR